MHPALQVLTSRPRLSPNLSLHRPAAPARRSPDRVRRDPLSRYRRSSGRNGCPGWRAVPWALIEAGRGKSATSPPSACGGLAETRQPALEKNAPRSAASPGPSPLGASGMLFALRPGPYRADFKRIALRLGRRSFDGLLPDQGSAAGTQGKARRDRRISNHRAPRTAAKSAVTRQTGPLP